MKKGLRLFCVLSIFVFALTGCSLPFGTPSAEKLIQGMTEYSYESALVNFDFLVDGSASVDGYEMEINTKTNANLECQKTKRGMLIYVNGSSKTDGEKTPIEMYVEYEGDDVTEYRYEEVRECWVYKEYEAELNEDSFADLQDALNAELARGEVAAKTEKREGVECYVLSATITGDDLADIGDIIMDIEGDFLEDADIDLEDLYDYITLDCTYYIDKEEGCLVQAVFDLSNSSFDDIAEELAWELEMDEISMVFTVSDYDEVEVEIPDEVLDEAVPLSSLVTTAPYPDEWEDDNWDYDGDDNWKDDNEDYDGDDNWDDSGNDLGDYDYDYDYDVADREAGTIIELPDYWDSTQTICEFRVPDGFYCSGTYSTTDYYDMMPTDDYTGPYMDFYVQNYLRTSDYEAYMYERYADYYTGYELQAIELDTSFRGNPVYLLHIAYETNDYVLENYNIITPYVNSHGEDSFITIEFYSGGDYMDPDSAKELFDAIFNY